MCSTNPSDESASTKQEVLYLKSQSFLESLPYILGLLVLIITLVAFQMRFTWIDFVALLWAAELVFKLWRSYSKSVQFIFFSAKAVFLSYYFLGYSESWTVSRFLIWFFFLLWAIISTESRLYKTVYLILQLVVLKVSFGSRIFHQINNDQEFNQTITGGDRDSLIKLTVYTSFFLISSSAIDLKFSSKLFDSCKRVLLENEAIQCHQNETESYLEEKRLSTLAFFHEFKNLLNGLLGSLKMAINTPHGLELYEILKSANICGNMLKNFSQNLLDSDKLERNMLEISPVPVDVAGFISSFWLISSDLIRAKKLNGFLRISKDVPAILTIDTQRLFQILLNLTTNAAKFTDKGQIYYLVTWHTVNEGHSVSSLGLSQDNIEQLLDETDEYYQCQPTIQLPRSRTHNRLLTPYSYKLDFDNLVLGKSETLSTDYREGTQGYLKISVIDSGSGMCEDDKQKIFKKFTQVSENVQDRQGHGLGLWITHELVKLMGGEIKVATRKGSGSAFEITIKAEVTRLKSGMSESFTSFQTASPKFDFNHVASPLFKASEQKILVADDDNFNRYVVSNYIRKLGVEIITAKDGEDLVAKYRAYNGEILAVITDNHMPVKRGIEAAREIKQLVNQHRLQEVPVFLLTGDGEFTSNKLLESDGVTEVLQKPIDLEYLLKRVLSSRKVES